MWVVSFSFLEEQADSIYCTKQIARRAFQLVNEHHKDVCSSNKARCEVRVEEISQEKEHHRHEENDEVVVAFYKWSANRKYLGSEGTYH
jgi:hypothetical protein